MIKRLYKLRSCLVLFALLIPISHLSIAQAELEAEEEVLSAGELLTECEEGATPTEPNQYCMRFVFGLVQTIDMLQQAGEVPKLFCIDPNVITLQEVTLKITGRLKAMPDRHNEDAYILVGQALNELYPCRAPGI